VATASSGPFKKPVTFASLASHHAANALNLANSSSSGVSNRVGSHSATSMCDSTTNVGNLIGGSASSSSASPSPVHFHQEMADRIRCEFKQNFYHFHKQMLDEVNMIISIFMLYKKIEFLKFTFRNVDYFIIETK
jgi:hypothetical protein